MKTVRILGNAPSLALMDKPSEDVEVWCCNARKGYLKWIPLIVWDGWYTRWFNLHSRAHMEATYRRDIEFYKQQTKPVYFQIKQTDIPLAQEFPYQTLIEQFKTDYFTCSLAWLIALAIHERFNRIELWGFEIAKRKPLYAWERPCVFYWIVEARKHGVEVWYPEFLNWDLTEAGDPSTHDHTLYGYDTKSEVGWNPLTKKFNEDI